MRRIDSLLAEARQMDIPLGDVIELIHQRDREMQPQHNED